MKPLSKLATAGMIAAGITTPADAAQTLDCSSGSGEGLSVLLGDGSVQLWEKGQWSFNFCERGDRCGWSGSHYSADGEYFYLEYESSTGALTFNEMGRNTEFKGICRSG